MSREGFIHNGQIVYRVIYTMTTGEGIVVSLDREGNDWRGGARHEDPNRRIVTTQVGDRIWALGQWRTVDRVTVHTAVLRTTTEQLGSQYAR